MMTGFTQFLEAQTQGEARDTILRLPKSHQKLTKGYKFKFENGCTLKGSKENIGMINLNDPKRKIIHVAAPWNYGRQFAALHEIAHLVYEKFCDSEWKKEWSKIVKLNKKRLKQSNEENWCHAYANHFVKNKIVIHTDPSWEKYMNEFCKATG